VKYGHSKERDSGRIASEVDREGRKEEEKRSERERTKPIKDDGPWSDTWESGAFQKIMLHRSR